MAESEIGSCLSHCLFGEWFADDQRLALDSGANDFLPEPVMEEELFEILADI
jgi:hypothetical protein